MYAQSPILKLPFLAASIACNQLVNTAPNPPPLPEERAKYLESGLVTLLPAAALLKVWFTQSTRTLANLNALSNS